MYFEEMDFEDKFMFLQSVVVTARAACESPTLHKNDSAQIGFLLYGAENCLKELTRDILRALRTVKEAAA